MSQKRHIIYQAGPYLSTVYHQKGEITYLLKREVPFFGVAFE